MTDITAIEGIGDAYAAKLRGMGISSTELLLQRGNSPKSREEIAHATGINDALILRWVNHADLIRIKGVASEYSELLEAAGVDTVPELARRNPGNLHQALVDANTVKKLVRQTPSVQQVTAWVDEANKLPRMVSY
jgi:predicted flap endonuclease-1-like 5' DNA nuclease